MDIDISYDSSASSAPSWFKSAVSYAVAQMDALIQNPITLNLTFSWGEENGNTLGAGTAAQNQSVGDYVDYATLVKALTANASSPNQLTAVASLPSTDPTNGSNFYIPVAMEKALGLAPANTTETDGYVGLDSSLNWFFNSSNQVGVGQYDPVSAIEHEITEVMGRVGYLSDSQNPGVYGPMDLFRYSAPGQRELTAGSGYFSIDGQTMGTQFNNPLLGGDAADWVTSLEGDTFGDVFAGIPDNLSATDIEILNVLGYTIGTVPPPATVAPTPAPTQAAPSLSIDTDVTFDSPRKVVVTGTVSEPSAKVVVFEGGIKLGTATVSADGTWSLTAQLLASSHAPIKAVATNTAGLSETVKASFTITTGILGKSYVTEEQILDDKGNPTTDVFVRRNGVTHTRLIDPNANPEGPANQNVGGGPANATDVITGSANDQTLYGTLNSVVTGAAPAMPSCSMLRLAGASSPISLQTAPITIC